MIEFALWMLSIIITAVAAFGFGLQQGGKMSEQDAIKAGVGRWTVDPVTGKTLFKYGVEERQ